MAERLGLRHGWSAGRHESFLRQPLDEQAGPATVAVPDFEVDKLTIEVRGFVGSIQAHLEVRLGIQKAT